ncbi:MAG: hypothetical protein K9H26_14585 [Prolixibacteraceae bacterium]|nr:hypothetical protein [Prolixibacteraceae bacterium]
MKKIFRQTPIKIFIVFFLIVTGFHVQTVSAQNKIFVDLSATGNNDGSDWTNAFTSLQSALDAAVSNDQIWVASGTYFPSAEIDGTGDRFKAFHLKNGVAIYGGFAGNEDPASFNLDNRDFTTNESILSGDLNQDDNFDAANGGYQGTTGDDNCYHVINHPDPGAGSLSADNTAILDGFTISGGNANGDEYADKEGGGMASHRGNPTLRNLIFKNNSAYRYGGGLRCYVSSSSVTNVKFIENVVTTYDGAGLFNTYCNGMVLTDLEFISNTAERSGAGMGCYYSSPTINSARFFSNTATYGGGGLYCNNSSPTVNNALFIIINVMSSVAQYNVIHQIHK